MNVFTVEESGLLLCITEEERQDRLRVVEVLADLQCEDEQIRQILSKLTDKIKRMTDTEYKNTLTLL